MKRRLLLKLIPAAIAAPAVVKAAEKEEPKDEIITPRLYPAVPLTTATVVLMSTPFPMISGTIAYWPPHSTFQHTSNSPNYITTNLHASYGGYGDTHQ